MFEMAASSCTTSKTASLISSSLHTPPAVCAYLLDGLCFLFFELMISCVQQQAATVGWRDWLRGVGRLSMYTLVGFRGRL